MVTEDIRISRHVLHERPHNCLCEMILSFRPLGKTERREIEAQIIREGLGQSTIVLEDGDILDLFSWRVRGCRIVKADRQEMKALVRMGLMERSVLWLKGGELNEYTKRVF